MTHGRGQLEYVVKKNEALAPIDRAGDGGGGILRTRRRRHEISPTLG